MESFDRSWMYNRRDSSGRTNASFVYGVENFIKFATSHPEEMSGDLIRCPCKNCVNRKFHDVDTVMNHLFRKGFVRDYLVWNCHGETHITPNEQNWNPMANESVEVVGVTNPYQQMVIDAVGPNMFPDTQWQQFISEAQTANNYEQGVMSTPDEPGPSNWGANSMDEPPNPQCQEFYDLLESGNAQLYPGCENHSQLSVVARMLYAKSEYNMPERFYDANIQLFKEALPEGNTLPENFYQTKSLVRSLGLPVQKIDCCNEGCMLFWRDDENLTHCKFCNHPRFKIRVGSRQNSQKSYKKMYYFPLIPRLQRLYQSKATALHMQWHHNHVQDDGVMQHPSDSLSWKHFNETHPSFAAETRNVRLGLCTDGFQPFGQYGRKYSSWPVIVTPYNLPPWMCMKEAYMFLTVIVPGPKNPKQKIDVFLQPLIHELNELWNIGVPTYDVSSKQNFIMRAALMWTINDFPAYSMMSGWSTSGKYACPYCMEHTQSFRLESGGKQTWFDNHRKFLPPDHPFRRNRRNFRIGHIETMPPPPIIDGEQILQEIDQWGLVKVTEFDADEINGFICQSCGWRKRSIFWDLPYWKSHLIRHNLDVMHVEKNVFDNVINTILNVEGKTKDNAKSRSDLQKYCCRPELAMDPISGKYPKACYTLDKESKIELFHWLSELKFPDGYVSNLGRCVDMRKLKLYGMKSHDCHIFMQRLIPVAFRELLPGNVWQVLTELSLFFKDLTSSTIRVEDIEALESNIPLIMCKLEKIFPPSFFDSMEHVLIHLPYEAKVAGPVQYRWMYPFERFLRSLKKKIGNKSTVEASICNAYLLSESSNFFSHYFEPHVSTSQRRPPRNDDGGCQENMSGNLSVFTYPGRACSEIRDRTLTTEEYEAAHKYILLNCEEVSPFLSIYCNNLREKYPDLTPSQIDANIDHYFADWFELYVRYNGIDNEYLRSLSQRPLRTAKCYSIYFVNGYKFHTKSHASGRRSVNSGVCVKGSNSCDNVGEYYGWIEEILELEYPSLPIKRTVLFKCHWFDPTIDIGLKIHNKYRMVDVNHNRRFNRYEPFILAMQATQVYYARYPSLKVDRSHWLAVFSVKPRDFIVTPHVSDGTAHINANAFQVDEVTVHDITVDTGNDDDIDLRDPSGVVIELNNVNEVDPVLEVDDDEEEFVDYDSNEDDDEEFQNSSDSC